MPDRDVAASAAVQGADGEEIAAGLYPVNLPEKPAPPPVEPLRAGQALIPVPPEVKLRRVLDELAEIFRRGAIFEDRYVPEATALWDASTHVFQDAAQHNPIFLVTADDFGGGKTVHLLNTAAAARNPLITTDPNRAQLYRLGSNQGPGKKPTFIIDEGDQGFFGKEGVTALVNAAWVQDTAHTYRSNMDPGKGFEQEKYSLWQPYAVGLIGTPMAPSTLSRCVVVRLRKANIDELQAEGIAIAPLDIGKARQRLRVLGQEIGEILTPFAEELRFAWPDRPSAVKDGRHVNNWRLLLAIADLAGEHWPFTARKAMVELTQPSRFAGDTARDLLELAAGQASLGDSPVITTADLAGLWRVRGRSIPWGDPEQWIADQLRTLSLTTSRQRVKGKGKVRGYLPARILAIHRAHVSGEEEREEEERDVA